MDKRAQKRRMFDKIREKVDIFGHAAEEFSPTFNKLMTELRNTDVMIRDSLLEQDPSLKDLLKSARSNFNKREYMASVTDLKSFHDKIDVVVRVLSHLQRNVDEAHNEFIFGGLPQETITGLKSLKDKFDEKKNASQENSLVKEAIFSDLWYALTHERGKAMRGWEKRYPQKMRKLKAETNSLIRKSEGLFSQLISSLKEMSSARAARNIEKYVKAADKITEKFTIYNAEFKTFYESNIKNFLEKLLLQEAEQNKKEEIKSVETSDTAVGDQEISAPATKKENTLFQALPNDTVESPKTKKDPITSITEGLPRTQKDPITSVEVPSSRMGPPTPPQSSGTRTRLPEIDPSNPFPRPPRLPQDLITPDVREELIQGTKTNPAAPMAKRPQVSEPPSTEMTGEPIFDPEHSPYTYRSAHPLLKTLQVLSSENPQLLAVEISKYAKSIETTDPKTSSKLFALVGKILNGQ